MLGTRGQGGPQPQPRGALISRCGQSYRTAKTVQYVFGSPGEGLDPTQDIKAGFLEEGMAALGHGGRASWVQQVESEFQAGAQHRPGGGLSARRTWVAPVQGRIGQWLGMCALELKTGFESWVQVPALPFNGCVLLDKLLIPVNLSFHL